MENTKDELKTDAMNREITVANDEDPFSRLPKDVMVNIMSTQADLKSLCRYSLVSKEFSESISGVRTVSVNLSGSGTYSLESTQFMCSLLSLMPSWNSEQICGVLKRFDFRRGLKSIRNINLPSFLRKLTELESVQLVYDYPRSDDGYPFPVQKMNFVGGSLEIEGFVALVPAGPNSIRIANCCDRKFLYSKDNKFQKASEKQLSSLWLRFYGRYCEWLCLALMLRKSHPSLRSVIINDPGLHAKLVMENELLAKIANTGYASEVFSNLLGPNILRFARIQTLHFPLSGYVMRWPSLVIIHAPDVDLCSSAEKLDQLMFGASGDEFEPLREAVSEVFKNHADEIVVQESVNNPAI